MAFKPAPLKTELSDTYPNPSNAVMRAGMAKLWDFVTSLLATTGDPADARALLGAVNKAGDTMTGDLTMGAGRKIIFEGTTDDAFETTMDPGDPTADRTVTLPNATTTLVGQDTSDTLTNKTISGASNTLTALVKSGTAQSTLSGAAIDFTAIPSWAKRITVMLSGVSTTGTDLPLLQLGTSGGIQNTGYTGVSGVIYGTTPTTAVSSAGFPINSNQASNVNSGAIVLSLIGSNTWVASGNIVGVNNANQAITVGGVKALGATLDRIRLTTTGGTDTFDAGSINIFYE